MRKDRAEVRGRVTEETSMSVLALAPGEGRSVASLDIVSPCFVPEQEIRGRQPKCLCGCGALS